MMTAQRLRDSSPKGIHLASSILKTRASLGISILKNDARGVTEQVRKPSTKATARDTLLEAQARADADT